MGKLCLWGINPKAWLISILVACLCIHLPTNINPGQPSLSVVGNAVLHGANHRNESPSSFYLTGNVTVRKGETYAITDENLVMESLYEKTMSFTVFGNLTILNSDLTLAKVQYSILANFSIYLEPGSEFTVKSSNLTFPGLLDFNHTHAFIENSTLNTSISNANNPFDSSLRISSLDSSISITNSTIDGLYRQNHSHEYQDGFQYFYETPYSNSNAIIPMVPVSALRNNAFINSVVVNITYTSNYNETNNFFKIGYSGTTLGNYLLPFNRTENKITRSIVLNFSGMEHNLSWMENNSNFYLMPMASNQTPIDILNISEYFLSNDTVSLYGNEVFSYNFTNSDIFAFNSVLGVNFESGYLAGGQQNPGKLYIILANSTLGMEDSSLQGQGPYEAPFFINHNSTLLFAKAISVKAYSHGIPVEALHYNISAYGQEGINRSAFHNLLNSTASNWVSEWSNPSVVYEAINTANLFNYTSTFRISSQGDSSLFSVSPFPKLNRDTFNVTLNAASVPYSTFNISCFKLYSNGTGSYFLNWDGNLSGMADFSVNWSLENPTQRILHGHGLIDNPGFQGKARIALNYSRSLAPGSYYLDVFVNSTVEHAFNNTGLAHSSFYLGYPPASSHGVNIVEQSNINGLVWGISIGNHTMYTNGTEIRTSISDNATARVIAPMGYIPSSPIIQLNYTEQLYYISFSLIQYEIIFENQNISNSRQWELIIGGKTVFSSNSSISIKLQPGSYNYEVIDPHGYALSKAGGIVQVQNSSLSVIINSVKIVPWTSSLASLFSTPEYYIPASMAIIAAIALVGWNSSHSWYVCKHCGSTRKRKKAECPYCGK